MEIPGSSHEGMTTQQCALRTYESSFDENPEKKATAFKFTNNSCTLGKTPSTHDAFFNKPTINNESSIHVAINSKPFGN